MGDEMLMHISSNSSNPSDPALPSKLAKLGARMVGKSSASHGIQSSGWSAKFAASEELPESSSDSDDDNGREFLILHNIQKRQKVEENDQVILQRCEGETDGKIKVSDDIDIKPNLEEPKKRQGRGRSRSVIGRWRGSKASNQMRSSISSSTTSVPNGHHESLSHKIRVREVILKLEYLKEIF